ncbi:MAG: DNA alkylation repair protein [Clostridiaceae bacterium]|nr:DNA alkylation repair protein [Clostridiaceae bacterium]
MSLIIEGEEGLNGLFSQMSGEKYRVFNESLIPGGRKTFGVRMPQLRAVAKDIAAGDWECFLAQCPDTYHEHRMIKGMVIASVKCTLESRMEIIRAFVPLIDNWAVCDAFCGCLKEADKRQAEYFSLICEYLESTAEYELRFIAVMLLGHYINEQYIDRALEIYEQMRHEGYYVKMAVAWGLSVCYIKFPAKTLEIIRRGRLDDFTHNKAIQKCRESFRVSTEEKEMLDRLKRR